MTEIPLKVAILKWGDNQEEGGLIAWTGGSNVNLISDVFSILSDLHIYCHGRLQQNEQLNRDAHENALELQQVLQEMLVHTPSSENMFRFT